jgi:hypothetical protein
MRGVGAAQILAQDTFTDANGTLLQNHTMDLGSGWTRIGTQDVSITSNQISYTVNSPANYQCQGDLVYVSVQLDWLTPASFGAVAMNVGLNTRYTDSNNFYEVVLDAVGAQFRIDELNAGVFTTRASASFTASTNTTYTIKGVWTGETLTGTVNGGTSISYTTTFNNTETRQGIHVRSDGTNTITCDNFKVTSP